MTLRCTGFNNQPAAVAEPLYDGELELGLFRADDALRAVKVINGDRAIGRDPAQVQPAAAIKAERRVATRVPVIDGNAVCKFKPG